MRRSEVSEPEKNTVLFEVFRILLFRLRKTAPREAIDFYTAVRVFGNVRVIFGFVRPPKLTLCLILCVNDYRIEYRRKKIRCTVARRSELDFCDVIRIAEDFVHQSTYAVNVFVADLHENGAGVC